MVMSSFSSRIQFPALASIHLNPVFSAFGRFLHINALSVLLNIHHRTLQKRLQYTPIDPKIALNLEHHVVED